jgi:PAS domain S-box-containing protein
VKTYEEMSKEELIAALRERTQSAELQAPRSDPMRLINELQVHQIELEMQNRELREAQQLLEDSRRIYADLYDFAPMAYFTLDLEGRIAEANLTAASLFGMVRSALIGRFLSGIMLLEDRRILQQHLEECFTQKVRVTSELTFSIKRSGPIVVQMISKPVLGRGNVVTGCKTVLTDITALKRSEERLRFLATASQDLSASFDYPARLRALVALAVPLFADLCLVDVEDTHGALRRVEIGCADPRKRGLVEDTQPPGRPVDPASSQNQVLRAGEPVLLSESAEEGFSAALAHDASLRAAGARSLLLVPLTARGKTFGTVTLAMAESGRKYYPLDLSLAQDFCSRAAIALDNARLYQAAQEATRVRDDLLAIVSHDLKNPLGSILLCSQLLMRHVAGNAEPQKKHLEAIQRSARQMDHLLKDLLDLSSIEAGHLAITPGEFESTTLLDEVFVSLAPLVKEKGLELRCESPARPFGVVCDRERVVEVFANLVGNAIKFTPEGGSITIGADRWEGKARFIVRDTGVGISADLLPRIFERYAQGDGAARMGRGLGLYITKGLVEAQAGTIWAESSVGAGTTLFFTLPLARTERASLSH